jgi:hypothetical protein
MTLWSGANSILPLVPLQRLTTWWLQWTFFDAFQGLPVKNGVWRPPAVEWSHWATLTLWSGADSILPLLRLQRIPNDFGTPMDLQSRFPKPPGQEWRLAPSRCLVVAMCDSDPMKTSGSILPTAPRERFPSVLSTPVTFSEASRVRTASGAFPVS